MVALAGKDSEIVKVVVEGVAVFVVYDVTGLEGKVGAHDLPGSVLALPVPNVGPSVACCKKGVITVVTAKVVLLPPDSEAVAQEDSPTSGARDLHRRRARFDAFRLHDLVDPLPGDGVLPGKLSHWS